MGVFKRREERMNNKKLEDGFYVAVIRRVAVKQGRFGEYLEVTFGIGANGITRRAILDTWVGERNLTRQFIDALKIEKNIEEIEEKDLIGRVVVVELKTVEGKKGKFQKIVSFREVK